MMMRRVLSPDCLVMTCVFDLWSPRSPWVSCSWRSYSFMQDWMEWREKIPTRKVNDHTAFLWDLSSVSSCDDWSPLDNLCMILQSFPLLLALLSFNPAFRDLPLRNPLLKLFYESSWPGEGLELNWKVARPSNFIVTPSLLWKMYFLKETHERGSWSLRWCDDLVLFWCPLPWLVFRASFFPDFGTTP